MLDRIVHIKTDSKEIENEITNWCLFTFSKEMYNITPAVVRLIYNRNKPPLWGFTEDTYLMFRLRWEDIDGVRIVEMTDKDINLYRKTGVIGPCLIF